MTFQLYKKRDFSAYISDTIAFFRGYWKNFFGNYITIAGGMIFVLCIFFFFFFRDLFSSVLNTDNGGMGYDIGYYFSGNTGLLVALLLIAVVAGLFLSIFNLAYPIAYLHLMENTGKTKFTPVEALHQIKLYLPRLIRFTLFSIGVLLPIVVLAGVISAFLIVIIIGFFLLLFLIPVSIILTSQMLFIYLHDDLSLFGSLRKAFKVLFSKKFWPIIGSTAVIYFIINTIQSLLTMIPYLFFVISLVLSGGMDSDKSNLSLLISGLYIVSIAVSYVLSNILMINQGLIFYGFKEQEEHGQAFSEIDSIGQNAE